MLPNITSKRLIMLPNITLKRLIMLPNINSKRLIMLPNITSKRLASGDRRRIDSTVLNQRIRSGARFNKEREVAEPGRRS